MLWLQQVFSLFFARKKKQFHAFHVNSKVLQYTSLPKKWNTSLGILDAVDAYSVRRIQESVWYDI